MCLQDIILCAVQQRFAHQLEIRVVAQNKDRALEALLGKIAYQCEPVHLRHD